LTFAQTDKQNKILLKMDSDEFLFQNHCRCRLRCICNDFFSPGVCACANGCLCLFQVAAEAEEERKRTSRVEAEEEEEYIDDDYEEHAQRRRKQTDATSKKLKASGEKVPTGAAAPATGSRGKETQAERKRNPEKSFKPEKKIAKQEEEDEEDGEEDDDPWTIDSVAMMVLDNGKGKTIQLPRVTLVRGEERWERYVSSELKKFTNNISKSEMIVFRTDKNANLLKELQKPIPDRFDQTRQIKVWTLTSTRSEKIGGSFVKLSQKWKGSETPLGTYKRQQVIVC